MDQYTFMKWLVNLISSNMSRGVMASMFGGSILNTASYIWLHHCPTMSSWFYGKMTSEIQTLKQHTFHHPKTQHMPTGRPKPSNAQARRNQALWSCRVWHENQEPWNSCNLKGLQFGVNHLFSKKKLEIQIVVLINYNDVDKLLQLQHASNQPERLWMPIPRPFYTTNPKTPRFGDLP